MCSRTYLNNLFHSEREAILASWLILIVFILTDFAFKSFIQPVEDWGGLLSATFALTGIIIFSSALSHKVAQNPGIEKLKDEVKRHLYWCVPLIYLLFGIIINVQYGNISDNFLATLNQIPGIRSLISFFG